MGRSLLPPCSRALFIGFLIALGLAISGCGDEDLCAGVTCDFGECDGESGECVNSDDCRTAEDCLPGYECDPDAYSCAATNPCTSDENCSTGVCDGQACVNPEECSEDDECLEGTFCGPSNTCEPDPCNDVTCQRGVCERGTDNCVASDTCTPETEQIDCLAGQKCIDETCLEDDDFCDALDCERGECSFSEGGCVNPSDCEGDDGNCLEGYFCNDRDQCQVDQCAQNEVDCSDSGECIASTGQCENAESCQDDGDCVEDHVCLEGTCRLEDAACGEAEGDGGCPGNKLCEIDGARASCVEPDECETSIDCDDDRQCGGLTCMDPVSCPDDAFEPNDSLDEATDFHEVESHHTTSGSLCDRDTDVFTFDSEELSGEVTRGMLLVELDIPERDLGLGEVELELSDDDGEVDSVSNGSEGAEGKLRIEESLDAAQHGEFTVEISSDDLNRAGVGYDLSINLLPHEAVEACQDATKLEVNQRVSGDTEEAESASLGSSCTAVPNEARELIYEIEVDSPQELAFELEPLVSSADLSMSLRKSCGQLASERGCVDEAVEGESERLEALVDEGTYYLIVQAADGATGGAFELSVDTIFTACAEENSYCEDEWTAVLCTSDGGRFDSVDCDDGCYPSAGFCFPPAGDVCQDAPSIDPRDFTDDDPDAELSESVDVERHIDLAQRTHQYEVASDSCIDGETQSGGPEQTYRVDIPAQSAMVAEASFADEVDGSLYVVEDCSDIGGSCVVGAAGSEEETTTENVTYSNQSDDDQTLYLVVDTAGGQEVSTADLSIAFEPLVCQAGETRCSPSEPTMLDECDEYGLGWEEAQECGFGCESNACVPLPDDCSTALDVTAEAKQSGGIKGEADWDDFSNDFQGFNCHNSSWTTSGEDFVLSVDLQDGETVSAEVTGTSGAVYPALAISTDCANATSTCEEGDESTSTASVDYTASGSETVYIIGDHDWLNSGWSFEYTVDIN